MAGARATRSHCPWSRRTTRGGRYLVSMLDENANWARNVRAAHGQAVLRHGHRETVRLGEVEPGARPPILRRYLAVAPGARSHISVDPTASTGVRTCRGPGPGVPCCRSLPHSWPQELCCVASQVGGVAPSCRWRVSLTRAVCWTARLVII